ncbi:MAG: hypothetical protein ABSE73_16770 [Planctomycetota bacterium]
MLAAATGAGAEVPGPGNTEAKAEPSIAKPTPQQEQEIAGLIKKLSAHPTYDAVARDEIWPKLLAIGPVALPQLIAANGGAGFWEHIAQFGDGAIPFFVAEIKAWNPQTEPLGANAVGSKAYRAEMCVKYLGRLRSPGAADALLDLLKKPESECLSVHVCGALGSCGSAAINAVPRLTDLARNPPHLSEGRAAEDELSRAAAGAISRIKR